MLNKVVFACGGAAGCCDGAHLGGAGSDSERRSAVADGALILVTLPALVVF